MESFTNRWRAWMSQGHGWCLCPDRAEGRQAGVPNFFDYDGSACGN